MAHSIRTRSVALLSFGVLALMAAALLMLLAKPPVHPSESATIRASVPAVPPNTSFAMGPHVLSKVTPVDLEPAVVVGTPLEAIGEIPVAIARRGSPLDSLRQRIMTDNPDIAEFRRLQRKILRKSQETQKLQDLYQNRDLIETAKKDLLADKDVAFSEEARFRRLYRVEYLGMGLEWKENPQRQALFNDVEEIILANNIRTDMEVELRRSLAGDKVELFMILLHNDRSRAEALLLRVQGTRLEKLLLHARVRYDALWAMGKNDRIAD